MQRICTALALTFVLPLILHATALDATESTQTDWSAGPGEPGPVTGWTARYDASTGISSLAVPDQLALTSSAASPVSEHLINNAYYGSFGMHPGDIDGDGDIDVLGAADYSGAILLWLNQGDQPPTWIEQTIDSALPGASAVFPADLDGDGHTDVVAEAADPGQQIVWYRNGGDDPITWTRYQIDPYWPDAFEIYADDVDLDGDVDVLCTSWELGDVGWWRNDGGDPIVWTRQIVDGHFMGAHSVKTADFDGDDDIDLVGAAGQDDLILWWRNDGGDPIVWAPQLIRLNYDGARSVCAEDIDADGDPDVVATAWTREVTWWRNDGGDPIVWVEQQIGANFNGGHSVEVADVNGDGRLDVLGAACLGHDITWWANGGGDPIVWTQHLVDGSCTNTVTVRAADVDGDGAVDVLGTSYYLGEFIWWDVTEFGTSGELTSSILDTSGEPPLTTIDWSAMTPIGTELRFQVRSSDDAGDLGAWSADITSPGSLGADLDRYAQYRVLMTTTDPDHSPILHAITLGTDMTGVGEMEQPVGRLPRHLDVRPNPFNPHVTISFDLASSARARLGIFDVSGRRVAQLADQVFAPGTHDLVWSGVDDQGEQVPSGTYLVCMEARERRDTLKVVLLR